MGRVVRKAIYMLLYVVAGISLLTAADFPAVDPSGWAVEVGAGNDVEGAIGRRRLIDLSLHASGVPDKTVPVYRERIEALLSGLPAYLEGPGKDLPRGEALLLFLHENVFKAYSEPQTKLDVLLDSGRYNCVSSAVLYMIAAEGIGLAVEGVATADHAFCRLPMEDGGVDVETTNSHGYNPGQKREFVNAFGQTGFSYVPPGNYRLRRRFPPGSLSV